MNTLTEALKGKHGNSNNRLKPHPISRKRRGIYEPKIDINRFSPWNLSEQSVLYACQVTVHRACFFVRIPGYNHTREIASIIF